MKIFIDVNTTKKDYMSFQKQHTYKYIWVYAIIALLAALLLVLIIQNNVGNKYSPTVIVAAITSQINKAKMPTHIDIDAQDYGLSKNSVVLLEQVRTLDKKWLKEKIGMADEAIMEKVNEALSISFGLTEI